MEEKILFEKYKIEKLLGEGNFGKVYKAKSLENGEIVAIKMISKEQVKQQGMVEQVKKEISIMSLVKHPNIVELKEVMATKLNIYLVMEYVGGGDLYTNVVQNGRIDENLGKNYFQQLITALDFCHSRGVCHRDLKLENILLDTKSERLKLGDFGLSTLLDQEDSFYSHGFLYTRCGAFAYMAPEIIRGEKYDGKMADIWSCGVILFTILAGYPPFQHLVRDRMLWKIKNVEYEFPSHFSQDVKDLIQKILVKNPNNRLTMDGIMRSCWFQPYGYDQVLPLDLNIGDNGLGFPCLSPVSFNAFDFILSMASGLDLSGLFEKEKREMDSNSSFITRSSMIEVMKAVEKIAQGWKCDIRRDKRWLKMVLIGPIVGRKGRMVVTMEVFEVFKEVRVVEFCKWGGDPMEYVKMMEEKVRPAMKKVALKWKGDVLPRMDHGGTKIGVF